MNNNMMKLLLIAGGIFAVCFGLFVVGSNLYTGYNDRQTLRDNLETEETTLTSRLTRLEKEKKEVERWRAISMPPTQNSAMMYKGFLQEMMLKHKFTLKSFADPSRISAGTGRQAAPVTSHISYDVVFESNLSQLIGFLQDFYQLNVPHAIKQIDIIPLGKGADTKLEVRLKVDVLSMSNSIVRNAVIANPTITIAQMEMILAMKRLPVGMLFGLSQLSNTGLFGQTKLASKHKPERTYTEMLRKNVFAGLAPASAAVPVSISKLPDRSILKFTHLTSITANYITEEGWLWVRKTNKYVKLRAEGGVNDFEIRDADNLLVLKGKVLAIKPRDLVFEYNGKAYALHVGQFVEDALKKELTPDELKKFDAELTAVDKKETVQDDQ